jgi:DNA-binding transcriptional regulator YbjK
MTKLTSAFGEISNLRTKSFELAGYNFKVRVPLTKELDAMQERIEKYDQAEFQKRFDKMTASFRNNTIEGVVVTDNDVIVEGRSTKELVETILQMENRVVEYIKLLVPVNGTLDEITYEEIEAEWPTAVQLEILAKISEAIQPGYKDSRKN